LDIILKTYASEKEFSLELSGSENILDKWILSRLNNLIKKVTKSLDKYDAYKASLSIEDFFINDLSLWYIRRSRKRFHSADSSKDAISTLYSVLLNIDKLIAPIIPFFAEQVYSDLKTKDMPESIHLYDWPKSEKQFIDLELENDMKDVRDIVALSLSERANIGIKIRQPLASLKIKNQSTKIKNNKELLDLIKQEVNVKEIIFDSKIKKEIELDATITKKLKEEGNIREIVRQIQNLRKKSKFTPKDKIIIYYEAKKELKKFLEDNKKNILSDTKAKDIKENIPDEISEKKKIIEIDKKEIHLGIKKVI